MALTAAVLKACFDQSISVLLMRGLGRGTSRLIDEAAALAKREVITIAAYACDEHLLENIGALESLKQAFSATQPSVLFIDGLDRADPKLQLQFAELVQYRCFGGQQLPANVTFIVTAETDTIYHPIRRLRPFVYEYSMF